MNKSDFYYREKFQPQIGLRFRFISGIIVGSLYAIVFYFLLYCTREILRVFTITENLDLWVFSEAEVQFYNLFFAFLSALLGQSICFSIWLERPKFIGKRSYSRTITILVDHKILLWFFLAWFSKLATGYVLLMMASYTTADFYIFSFYPKYKFLFVIIIIVLFLQQWTGFLRKYKRHGYKWVLISAIVLSIFSITISRINVLDYQGLNEQILSQNVYEKYNLTLPKSEFYRVGKRKDRFERLYMVWPLEGKHKEPFYILEGEDFPLNDLPYKIFKLRNKKPVELRNQMTLQLNIDPNIKMDYVEILKEDLSRIGISMLEFATVPTNHELNEKYYINHYFPASNQPYFDFIQKSNNDLFEINIKFSENQLYEVNSMIVKEKDLDKYLLNQIEKHPEYTFIISISPRLKFKQYFFMIKSAHQTVLKQRDSYSLETYGVSYMELSDKSLGRFYRQKLDTVIQKFPLMLKEKRIGDFKNLNGYLENAPPPPPKPVRID